MNDYPLLGISRLRMTTDGEGVTTLVAGAGCPLACRYCINGSVLTQKPRPITPEALYERVRIDDLYFRATGGGVTFGGGEALLHVPFIRAFRQLCPDWKLYAETSLAVDPESVEAAAETVDGFIVDIKSTDPEIYQRYTGRSLLPRVLENLQLLLRLKGPENILVRIPRIPEYNTAEDCSESERYLRSLGVTRIDRFDYILPRS